MPDWQSLLFATPPTVGGRDGRQAGWERGVDPTLVAKARQLQDLAAQEGIQVRITTGYRSPEEQQRLYNQGRSAPGKIVTYAKPGTSRHQHGTAMDIVPLKDGQPDWDSPHWDRLGELGEGLGLRWGGRFPRLKDRPHFELPTAPGSEPGTGVAAPLPATQRRAPATPRDWGQELFATPSRATPAAPDRSALVQRIRREALRQGVDPELAVAVATQESGLNPAAVGDRGKSLGLFQLQRAAAIDAGIDPDRRGDPEFNIPGGIRYLKQGLDRFGGDPRQALERHYNRGGDPDYYAHVMQYYAPAAPEPSAPQAAPAPPQWAALLGLEPAPARVAARPTPAASPPTPSDWGSALGQR